MSYDNPALEELRTVVEQVADRADTGIAICRRLLALQDDLFDGTEMDGNERSKELESLLDAAHDLVSEVDYGPKACLTCHKPNAALVTSSGRRICDDCHGFELAA